MFDQLMGLNSAGLGLITLYPVNSKLIINANNMQINWELYEVQQEHCRQEAERVAEQERYQAKQLLFDADYNQYNQLFRQYFTIEQLINYSK